VPFRWGEGDKGSSPNGEKRRQKGRVETDHREKPGKGDTPADEKTEKVTPSIEVREELIDCAGT